MAEMETDETPCRPVADRPKRRRSDRSEFRSKWRTPRIDALKTPRTHRIVASAAPKTPRGQSKTAGGYEALLKKAWKVHAVSPLFKFNPASVSLKRYGRSLDIAFSKGAVDDSDSGSLQTKSSFEMYHGLSFHPSDQEAVKIEVTNKTDSGEKIVLTAFLMCVDIEDPVLVQSPLTSDFTFYPLLLVNGGQQYSSILLEWLQSHFDCRTSSIEFTDLDLRWILTFGCQQDSIKSSRPVALQYGIGDKCDGIDAIDADFEADFCKGLWDKLQLNSSTEEYMTEKQVFGFVRALEAHLEFTMHIYFQQLSLSAVTTPMCQASKAGKFSLFDSKGVYVILHMLCEMITEKYVDGYEYVSR